MDPLKIRYPSMIREMIRASALMLTCVWLGSKLRSQISFASRVNHLKWALSRTVLGLKRAIPHLGIYYLKKWLPLKYVIQV